MASIALPHEQDLVEISVTGDADVYALQLVRPAYRKEIGQEINAKRPAKPRCPFDGSVGQ